MSLTRKMLAAMELDAEKIDQIISGHSDTVAALQGEIDKAKAETEKYKAEAGKLGAVQKELDDLKKQVEADAEERKSKDYDALKKEFDDFKAAVEAKEARASKEAAYREILRDAGIPEKHFAKILKYSDVDGVELDESGKITTAKEILKSIREEWSDHILMKQEKGADVSKPPQNLGGAKMTKEQIMGIKDWGERQKAIAENHELFGF